MVNDGLEFQVDVGSAQNMKVPKYLKAAHQILARMNVPNKTSVIAVFQNLDVKKNLVEIDGYRYPKHAVLINTAEKDYIDQYRDLKRFLEEYVG